MRTAIFKVLACGEITQAPSQNQQGGVLYKRQILLQEFGGQNRQDTPERQSNAIVATMLGELAKANFQSGTMVVASLRFSIRQYQGQWYQDCTVVDTTSIS